MHRSRPSRENGAALAVVLTIGVPVLVALGSVTMVLSYSQREIEQSAALSQARSLASSGAHDALARLDQTPNYTGTYQLALGGGTVQVAVSDWGTDGLDNDANGLVDEAAEQDIVGVSSTGWVNAVFDANGNLIDRPVREYRSRAEVLLRRINTNIPVNQSVFIGDPLADIDFDGNAFLIDGSDTNLDGTPGPNPPLPGMGTPGDPQYIIDQLGNNQQDNVIGAGGTPSVLQVPDADLNQLINSLAPLATMTWEGPADSYSGPIGSQSPLQMIVAHAKGDLTVTGDSTGAGILIVDGDLELRGAFNFVGLVLCRQAVAFRGGGGSKDITGAVMCLGAVDVGEDVTLNGSVQLRMSSEAMTAISTQLAGGYAVLSWIEN